MLGWEHRDFLVCCFYSRDVLNSIQKPIVIIKLDIENYECKVIVCPYNSALNCQRKVMVFKIGGKQLNLTKVPDTGDTESLDRCG